MRQKRTVRASSVSRRRGVWLGRAIFFSLVRGDYDGPLSISYPRNTHLVPSVLIPLALCHPKRARWPRGVSRSIMRVQQNPEYSQYTLLVGRLAGPPTYWCSPCLSHIVLHLTSGML